VGVKKNFPLTPLAKLYPHLQNRGAALVTLDCIFLRLILAVSKYIARSYMELLDMLFLSHSSEKRTIAVQHCYSSVTVALGQVMTAVLHNAGPHTHTVCLVLPWLQAADHDAVKLLNLQSHNDSTALPFLFWEQHVVYLVVNSITIVFS